MSTTPEPSLPAKPSRFRTWFLRLLIALAVIVPLLGWLWPSETLERGPRVFMTTASWFLAALGFELWLILYYRLVGIVGFVLGIGLIAACYTRTIDIKNDGDLMPTSVHLSFLATPASDLETYRASNTIAAPEADAEGIKIAAEDFPAYRGRSRDGVAEGPALARDWKAEPPQKLWRHPVGGGYAAFAIAGNSAVTIEQRRDEEAVVCYDTESGGERWVYSYKTSFAEPLGGPGPRATPTIFDGDVYSLGAKGHLTCLDGKTGKEKWSAEILTDNDNIMWAMSGSPLVYRDLVVVNPGAQRKSEALRALVAFERQTGKRRWASGTTKAGYASPMIASLAGLEQVVLFDGVELAGYDANDGAKLWSTPWKTHQDINVAQPLILDGDRVFISSGYGVGCAMFRIAKEGDTWTATELWKNRNLRSKMSSPLQYKGYVYGLDDGVLVCLDAGDGSRKWKGKRYGHGQILLAGDLVVVLAESGNLVIVEATPEAFRELGTIAAIEGRTWNYPALARGRVYVRNDIEMACYDIRAK